MKTALTVVMLAAFALLVGLSLLEWASDSGWIPPLSEALVRIAGGAGLAVIALIGGVMYWIDRRRRND